MSVPVLEKTWQFDVNKYFISTGVAATDAAELLRGIKDSLKSFSGSPWTTVFSCDATVSGVGTYDDGVDRWTDNSKLVWNAGATAHSWYVLRQSGLTSNFQICLDLNIIDNGSMTIAMSPSAGFSIGGTRTARPTASDEIILVSNTYWGFGSNIPGRNHIAHIMQSTDGQCTRIVIIVSGSPCALWLFDKPKDPVNNWTDPCVGLVKGDYQGTAVITTANLYSGTNLKGLAPNGAFVAYCSAEGRATACCYDNLFAPNDISGEVPFFPIGIQSETAGSAGRHGRLADIYYGISGRIGKTFPDDRTRQFIQIGVLVLPWSGAVPIIA